MRTGAAIVNTFLLLVALLCGCGGGTGSSSSSGPAPAATPTLSTTPVQNGAQIVSLSDSTPGTTIRYTLDGTTPTMSSQIYEAPFLVAANITVNAIGMASGFANSAVVSKQFTPNLASNTLVWSDEFSNAGSSPAQPDAKTWIYDTGYQCCGNNEQETYCAWGSNASPCNTSSPNAFVGTDGNLHVVAEQPSKGVYTSGRLKSQGLFSFMYGRIEARMKLPESQGMWPAFWLLGNSIATINWPACGELDIMEHIDGSNPPDNVGAAPPGYDWVAGSVHGGPSGNAEINGTQHYHASTFSAADWHTYGMIWSKGVIQFYVDDPANIYATFKSTDSQWTNNSWPFDQGPQYILLNLAVGGDWPGNVDKTTVFPSEMLVDYVRIYSN